MHAARSLFTPPDRCFALHSRQHISLINFREPMQKAKEVEQSHEGGRQEYKMGCHFYGHGEYPKAEKYFLQAKELSSVQLVTFVAHSLRFELVPRCLWLRMND